MKEITKDNKGITLVSLIITIIIMSILLSVVTYSGIDTYKNAKITNFVAQMQLIQTKVDELVESKTIEEINDLGLQGITTEEQENAINSAYYNNEEITTNEISRYKVFTTTELLNIFDIEDIKSEIMVNFTTREVVSVDGIEYDGETYYTQYKLPNGQALIQNKTQTDRGLSFNLEPIIDGLNASIKISNISITNGTLSYKEQNDSYWNNITNYTKADEEYNISVSKSGTYEFVLKDNVTGENSNTKIINEETEAILETVPEKNKIVLVLTNAPNTNQQTTQKYNYNMDSNNWAYVMYNDISYLWIPRFAYKINTETNEEQIKFLKGNSSIATDNTYIDATWNVHEKFTNNGVGLTGIWVKIESQIGLDMISLLDSDYEILTEINV